MRRRVLWYFGIDIDGRMVDSAKKRGVHVDQIDLFELSCNEQFDVITASQVLEHIKYPRAFLSKIDDLLAHDGLVVVDVPNNGSLSSLLHRFVSLNSRRFGAIVLPHHAMAYSPRSLGTLFELFFDVNVTQVSSLHSTFGQAAVPSLVGWLYNRAAEIIGRPGTLVATGRKRSEQREP
jgi:SAM-dependent methyltransferase